MTDRAESPLERARTLLKAIADIGRKFPAKPDITRIETFQPYLADGALSVTNLDRRDGGVTRREALVRFLLLSAVLDQGPDIEGVRDLVAGVTNDLYRREIRFLHRPLDFFQWVNVSVEQIHSVHEAVKMVRAADWARRNRTNPGRYLLYMDNARQTLGYAVYRWGVPLALSYLLAREAEDAGSEPATALIDYLTSFPSAEAMATELKDNPKYGLGKAVGDKAAHLFVKWVTYSYPLLLSDSDPGWSRWSFEIPFDSNAGRVLYRTGFFSLWASPAEYRGKKVLQPGAGKGGTTYLRVTNIRGMPSSEAERHEPLVAAYADLCVRYLKTHRRRPQRVEIQRIASAVSLIDRTFSPGDVDDGLTKVGTTWCLNIADPNCGECPLNTVCEGTLRRRELINDVRT
jgi:hypothetical protein